MAVACRSANPATWARGRLAGCGGPAPRRWRGASDRQQRGLVGRTPLHGEDVRRAPTDFRNPSGLAVRISRRVHRATGVPVEKVLGGLVVIVLQSGWRCGDDDDGGTAASDDGSAMTEACGGGEADTVRVTACGSAFDPTTAQVKAGDVFFDITNEDDVRHTLTFESERRPRRARPERLRQRGCGAGGRPVRVALRDPLVDDRHLDRLEQRGTS